jgi:protein-S-isoprenylcysteine O-methyltransferase Ste14
MPSRLTPDLAVRALWLIWIASWLVASGWSDRTVKAPAARRQIVYRLLAAAGFLLAVRGVPPFLLDAELTLWRTDALAWTMVALTLAGLLFTWWARIHLGRLWSSDVARKADHHVVDTGPYGIVRHPIYTGILVASTATAAVRATPGAWLGAGLMTLGWCIKARMEEAFLREQLGAEQSARYARRVPMLVPFLPRNRSPRSDA